MSEISDLQLFRTILDELPTGVYLVDRQRKVRFWNNGGERLTGFLRQQVLGQPCWQTFMDGCNQRTCELCGPGCVLSQSLNNGETRESNVYFRNPQGDRIPVHLWNAPIRDERGSLIGVAGSFHKRREVADRDRDGERLAAYGCLDETTGLANHGFTDFKLRESFTGLKEYHIPFGIVLVHLEGLTVVARQCGKSAADAIALMAAKAVIGNVRGSELLGRWADDQLLLIARVCAFPHLEFIAQRIRNHLSSLPLHWWGETVTVRPLIGSAGAEPMDSPDSLVVRAQLSLQAGRGQHENSDPGGSSMKRGV
jgi:PAS domain S-box-containing protein